jgi:hypothetical protein
LALLLRISNDSAEQQSEHLAAQSATEVLA